MSAIFQFKQFAVTHDKSTMKVGTDAMLLGAWARIPSSCSLALDIGTGSGVVALMIAQRCKAEICGVDIHGASIEQAVDNAICSPWASRMHFKQGDIREVKSYMRHTFQLIVSNPPFFNDSLHSPQPSRNISRHTDTLTYAELAYAVSELLAVNGTFNVILPADTACLMEQNMLHYGCYLHRKCVVYPKQGKPAHRVLMEYGNYKLEKVVHESLCIRSSGGDYTMEYRLLTQDYHIIF